MPSTTISLAEALTPSGASKVTPFGGVILSATLFGHNFQHLHQVGPNENPDDLENGEFWKRHRKMDSVLTNTFMFLPDHLRLSNASRDMNVVFLHLTAHASSICLHQAAVLTAEKHKLDHNFIRQCRYRSLTAAEEITNIMRLFSHVDASQVSILCLTLQNSNLTMILDEYLDGLLSVCCRRSIHSGPEVTRT